MLRHPRSPVFLFCKWDISSQKARYLHYHVCRYLETCRSQMARRWLIVRSTMWVNVFPDHLKLKITWSRTTRSNASPREKSAETCLTICSHQAGDWNLCKIMTVQRSMMTGGRIVGSAAEDWDNEEKQDSELALSTYDNSHSEMALLADDTKNSLRQVRWTTPGHREILKGRKSSSQPCKKLPTLCASSMTRTLPASRFMRVNNRQIMSKILQAESASIKGSDKSIIVSWPFAKRVGHLDLALEVGSRNE